MLEHAVCPAGCRPSTLRLGKNPPSLWVIRAAVPESAGVQARSALGVLLTADGCDPS